MGERGGSGWDRAVWGLQQLGTTAHRCLCHQTLTMGNVVSTRTYEKAT